jgi:hypothetical protein
MSTSYSTIRRIPMSTQRGLGEPSYVAICGSRQCCQYIAADGSIRLLSVQTLH